MAKALIIFAVALTLHLPHAQGQAQSVDERAKETTDEIFSNYMSPFCPGRLLRDCPSSQASDLRHRIEGDLQNGQSKEDVVQNLIATYGDEVRAAPLPVRFGLVGWVAPFAFLLVGLGVFATWLWRKSSRAPNEVLNAQLADELHPEIRQQIERELREP